VSGIVRASLGDLLSRTRDLATLTEEELRRFAAQAARDRDAEALWALTEAHLTLHGAAGANVSVHTLTAYRIGVRGLLEAWQGENLLRPRKNAGVLWVRELEGRFKPATVGVKLAAAKALYAALRWSGATEISPFTDVKPARDKTPAWAKRDAYSYVELEWLLRCAEGTNLLIVLLGAHAGLRVSEMTALRWEHVDLLNAVLTVYEGKGKKTAWVALSQTLSEALEAAGQREGFVLPCRASQSVYERVESLCRRAKVRFKGVHALRHSSGTRLHEETGDIVLVADHLRHSSLDTARGYAKSNNTRVRKAVGGW
jgi:integrase/recombinase XerC